MQTLELPPDQPVFFAGSPCSNYILVVAGSIRVQVIGEGGREAEGHGHPRYLGGCPQPLGQPLTDHLEHRLRSGRRLINRDGIGDDAVAAWCATSALPILLRIPMERRIAEGIARGATLVGVAPEYRSRFRDLLENIISRVPA